MKAKATSSQSVAVHPKDVHATISRYMLADGEHLVIDLAGSHGPYLRDAATGREYLDFYAYFASLPIGHNHPKLREPWFMQRLAEAALHNPANSDVYTTFMAEFVETFARIAKPADMPHLFLVSGGALAVENALKTAFDWKVRKNLAAGKGEKGSKIIHFCEAFHGRSGYTLSLTNTADPRKYQYFPRFDWPRIVNPKLRFPVTDQVLAETIAVEHQAIEQIKAAVRAEPGRDRRADHRADPGRRRRQPLPAGVLRRSCAGWPTRTTSCSSSTRCRPAWAPPAPCGPCEQMGVKPDIIAFGKKAQVCGIIAGPRIDEVPNNVFAVSSRINSTWGGNLADMVRGQRYLEIIAEDKLVENAGQMGQLLLERPQRSRQESDLISNVRGRGMMVAFDLPDSRSRDIFRGLLLENGLVALKCGERSIRFRPPLDLDAATVEQGLAIVEDSLFDARSDGAQL